MTEENKKAKKLIWKNEKRKISELKNWERNPRKANEKQVGDVNNSLNRFGLAEPIVANTDGTIIGGHLRIRILKDKGETEADVRVPNRKLTEKEVEELNIRLNKNVADWDYDLLANFDEDILQSCGFESEELDKIFQLDLDEDIDEVPEPPEKPKTKLGDLYQLGEHRLLCGDSMKKEDVEKLMNGKKADMVFTDPPYGIDLDSSFAGMPSCWASHKYDNKYQGKVIGDEVKFNASFLIDLAKECFLFGADYYANTLPESGINGTWYIWDKREDESGDTFDKMLGSPFEMIWGKKKRGKKFIRMRWASFFTSKTTGEKTKDRVHPTQKPIELCKWFIEKFSKRGQNIIDLFGGSGSTLIACEQLNRKCFMMEIDPKYCDVIISRWEKLTNKKAKKL